MNTEIETRKASGLKRSATLRRSANGDLRDLKRSVKKFGMLQPIIERKADHSVIIGERRRSVAKALGITAPVVAVDVTPLEAAEMRVAEELSHEPHDRIALAEEIRRIYEENGGGTGKATFTVKDLAARLGVSESRVKTYFELAGMPDALKREVAHERLSTADALEIEKTALKDEDKIRLAEKAAEGKFPRGETLKKEVIPAVSRAPREAVSWIRNKETTWADVKRAEVRKTDREAAGSTDTVKTLEMEVRAMVQRWVDTLSHKGNFDLIPLMTERGWHDVEMALLRLEEASRKWRSARPPARKVGESRAALAGDSGKFKQMMRDLSGVWHAAD